MSDINSIVQKLLHGTVGETEEVPQAGNIMPDETLLEVPVEETPEPEPTLEVDVDIVQDSNHPKLGLATIDMEAKLLVFYLHEGQGVATINVGSVIAHIDRGENEFQAGSVAKFTYDETQIRTCSWYEPSAGQVDAGAEEVDSYVFDKPASFGVCTNPEMQSSDNSLVPCPYVQRMVCCSGYSMPQVVTLRRLRGKDEGGKEITLSTGSVRRSFGFKTFQVLNETDSKEVLYESSTMDQGADAGKFADEILDVKTAELGLNDVEELEVVTPEEEVEEKEKYFEYVLATK